MMNLLKRGLEYGLMGALVAGSFLGENVYAKSSSHSSSHSSRSISHSTTKSSGHTTSKSTPSATKSTKSTKSTTTPSKSTTSQTSNKSTTPSKSSIPNTSDPAKKSSYTHSPSRDNSYNFSRPYRYHSSPGLFDLGHPFNPIYPWSPFHNMFFNSPRRSNVPINNPAYSTNDLSLGIGCSGSWVPDNCIVRNPDYDPNAPIKTENKGGSKAGMVLLTLFGLTGLAGAGYYINKKMKEAGEKSI